jgi:hypothetical protein
MEGRLIRNLTDERLGNRLAGIESFKLSSLLSYGIVWACIR